MSFGKRLRAARQEFGKTQEEFAEMGGVKRVSQHLYEQDARTPNLTYLLRLRDHGVDILQLLVEETGTTLTPTDVHVSAFRLVDKLARDESGDPLPYPDRERYFRFLCEAMARGDATATPADIRDQLVRLASS